MTFTTLLAGGGGGMIDLLWPIALMIGIMYFIIIRPQKKREKAVQEMRSKVEVGDSILTVGGIIGIVVKINDDSFVIETSADRTKIRIAKMAIQINNTANEAQIKARQEALDKKKQDSKEKSGSAKESKDEPKPKAEPKAESKAEPVTEPAAEPAAEPEKDEAESK